MRLFNQYGSFTMAHSITNDPSLRKFHGHDGYIAYHDTHNVRIVIGDPICPPESWKPMIRAFVREADILGLLVVGMQTSLETARIYHSLGYHATHMGTETHLLPTWNMRGKKVARRIRKAFKNGLTVKELTWASNPTLRGDALTISRQWFSTRKNTTPLNLLLREPDFMDRPYERTFFAFMKNTHGIETMVGYVTFEAIYRDGHCIGWYANINRRDDSWNVAIFDAIIHSALETFAREPHFERLSLGLAPLSRMKNPHGIHNQMIAWINDLWFAHANHAYSYQGIFQAKKNYWPKRLDNETPEVDVVDTYCISSGSLPIIQAARAFMAVGIFPKGLHRTAVFGTGILLEAAKAHLKATVQKQLKRLTLTAENSSCEK